MRYFHPLRNVILRKLESACGFEGMNYSCQVSTEDAKSCTA